MPRLPSPRRWLLLLATAGAAPLHAQASPFLPTDDPRMPLIEHLIARGEIRDPSPLERPFRKGDIVAALVASSNPVAQRLAQALTTRRKGRWYKAAVRVGVEGYTQGRKDLLQDGGKGNPGGYAEFDLEAARSSLVVAERASVDTRRNDDPDLTRTTFFPSTSPDKTFRIDDWYLALQPSWGEVRVGQLARNWGPVGIPGVPLSDAAYPRPDISVSAGRGALRFSSIATRLRSDYTESGEKIERYYVAHRLSLRAGRDLTIAAWEVGVIAGTADQLDGSTRAIVPLLAIPALLASRSHRNELVGGDISWRPAQRLRFEAQLAIDDWNFDANNPYPQRWAGSVSGSGALGRSASWRASYTTASSLAFRTLNPEENIVDQGVGIGRLFPDNDIIDLSVAVPVRVAWLVTPRLALLRQGEGRIETPFPTFAEAASVPARFIGVVASSYWAGAGLSGSISRLQLSGEGGLRYTHNFQHVAGRTSTTLEGRVTATLGFNLWKADR